MPTPPWPTQAVEPAAPQVRALPGAAHVASAVPGTRGLTLFVWSMVGLTAVGAVLRHTGGMPLHAQQALALMLVAAALLAALVPVALLVGDPRVDRAIKPTWLLLGASALALSLGRLGTLGLLPPGAARAAILAGEAFHPLVLAGVIVIPCGMRTLAERSRVMIEVIVVAGAALAITAVLVPDGASALHASALPGLGRLGDGLLFATLAMLWLRGIVSRPGDAFAPLGVGCLAYLVSELLAATAHQPLAAALAGALGAPTLALVGLSAVRQRVRVVTQGLMCGAPRRLSVIPTLAAAAALTVLAIRAVAGEVPARADVVAAVFVGLAALARQVIAIRDEIGVREQSAHEQADRRLAALVRHGSDMLTILEADTLVRYASPSHLAVMGIPPELLVGRRMKHEIHRDDLPAAEQGFARLLSGESMRESLVVRLRDGTGTWRWIEAVGTNLFNEPTVAGLVLNSRDITDRKQLEGQLLEQALRDPLTGLGNRRLFVDRVSHALETRQRRGTEVALLLLDLDHFKFINDTLGHAKGDALLVSVSERLHRVLRSGDTVARLGGDEFAVLLEDLASEAEAEATAARIQTALGRPFRLDEREVFVRASIGIAWATDGQDVDALLTDADVAMYGAKNSGRGRIERYSSAMRAQVAERVDLEADLRNALVRGELDVVYQPVVDLQTGHIAGAEALIRWHHPVQGLILPGRFIPVAEESELILDVGRFVTCRATMDVARFRRASAAASRLRVAVNLSARHLLSPDLVPDVERAVAAAGITGDALAVELTESVLASNEPVVAGRLQALRDLGVRIALDDFGTGYSSLAYLRRFPIDVLKVDKSFVSHGAHDVMNDGVTQAIVSIGHSLRMRTIAEGVETEEQLTRLREIGCALGQGYLFSHPLERDAFEALVATWDNARFARPAYDGSGALLAGPP